MDESTEQDAACREAWEEAGIEVKICGDLGCIDEQRKPNEFTSDAPKASYRFFEATVTKLLDAWPESDKRDRRWMSYAEAAHALRARPELLEALNRCTMTKE